MTFGEGKKSLGGEREKNSATLTDVKLYNIKRGFPVKVFKIKAQSLKFSLIPAGSLLWLSDLYGFWLSTVLSNIMVITLSKNWVKVVKVKHISTKLLFYYRLYVLL